MDYQALSMLVPKPVEVWTTVQIRKWLHFIHMQSLLPLFQSNIFNGSQLSKTTIKTLSQMGVKSNIMQKKLMVWIEKGFMQFSHYLQSVSLNFDKENMCPNTNLNRKKTTNTSRTKKIHQLQIQSITVQQPNSNKLKITNFEGPKNVNYIADSKGLRIGRFPTNQIQSLEVTVQNNHAQIFMQNNQFFLVDLGTASGTSIKIHYKIELVIGMLIELGSYLMRVKQFSNLSKTIIFQCMNIMTTVQEKLTIDLTNKNNYSIGRRIHNDFYRDDQHMSSTHAKIYYFNGKFILEDMGSTNGTWLRLSEFKKMSQPYKLEDGSIFKIGNTITYICSQESKSKNQGKIELEENCHICMDCNDNFRNILFLPCKHTISCENCCIEHQTCPLCMHAIEEKIKIFI